MVLSKGAVSLQWTNPNLQRWSHNHQRLGWEQRELFIKLLHDREQAALVNTTHGKNRIWNSLSRKRWHRESKNVKQKRDRYSPFRFKKPTAQFRNGEQVTCDTLCLKGSAAWVDCTWRMSQLCDVDAKKPHAIQGYITEIWCSEQGSESPFLLCAGRLL